MKKGNFTSNNRGITFIEIIVSLGILLALILILATTLNTVKLNRDLGSRTQAMRLAAEELEIVRNLPTAAITNRANSDFVGVFYNQGGWTVAADATAPSAPNVLTLNSAITAAATNLSGALIFPGDGGFANGDFEARIKILNPAPTSTMAGLIFRARDAKNFYRLTMENSVLRLEKIVNGNATTLLSPSQTFLTDTWYKVKISGEAATLSIALNDILLGTTTDSAFSSGKIGIFTANGTKISIDGISILGAILWNFDADPAGDLPSGLKRFGLFDLPGGEGELTIENFQAGVDTLKKITVRITWVQNGSIKSAELQTVKNL
ncbi:MAG: hypothetical protein AAB731_03970 [Patescibacteria group bacterium]